MSGSWHFDDLTFSVLWEKVTGEDDLPTPFIYTSRTPGYFDHLREKRKVAEGLRTNWDRSFDDPALVIAKPDIAIIVNGFDGRDPERADGRVRLLALRRGPRGYLIRQLPGETYLHSSGFTVTECDPLRLADAVVTALPECEAGRHGAIALVDTVEFSAVEQGYARSPIRETFEDPVPLRQRKFFASPAVSRGTIDIVQSSSEFGPQGAVGHRLWWRDLEDDGRYVIGGRQPVAAVPTEASQLITVINLRVAAVIRAIKDERGLLRLTE